MSKAAKSRARFERVKQKRAKKAAKVTLYEGWRDSGRNLKSKRFVLARGRSRMIRGTSHPDGPCGNLACRKCMPGSWNDPWQSAPGSYLYTLRFTSPLYRQFHVVGTTEVVKL